MELRPLALGAWSLSRWTTREVPIGPFPPFTATLFEATLFEATLFEAPLQPLLQGVLLALMWERNY